MIVDIFDFSDRAQEICGKANHDSKVVVISRIDGINRQVDFGTPIMEIIFNEKENRVEIVI